ncbi:MAG: TRAP transporter small permease [Saccharospirillum sp.]
MTAYLTLFRILQRLNNGLIRLGHSIAWVCVALMVLAILLQVFFRYVLNNALPWPEEVARALMIWMMALVAAGAYRQGSFVAIEMLHDFLPRLGATLLKLFLHLCALVVLYYLFTMGLEFFQRGFRTRAASFNMPRAWIYLAMPVCFGTMLIVNIEMLMKDIGILVSKRFAKHIQEAESAASAPLISE